MTIKQLEPLLTQKYNHEIWVFTPKGEDVLDIIKLDPAIKYLPTIDRNRLKLEYLEKLPHKVVNLIPVVNPFDGAAKLLISVSLGKGVGWNV